MDKSKHWYAIPVPPTIQLLEVLKETSTHGSLYSLFECEERSNLFIGQSIPALTKAINSKAIVIPEKRLHCSSLYRVLRSESKKTSHKNWKVTKYNRNEIDKINTLMKKFPGVIFISKTPELWKTLNNATTDDEIPENR